MATKTPQHTLEQRVRALEQAVEELRKIVGDLKYEVEQMREA
jgi:TolA-binding protein